MFWFGFTLFVAELRKRIQEKIMKEKILSFLRKIDYFSKNYISYADNTHENYIFARNNTFRIVTFL